MTTDSAAEHGSVSEPLAVNATYNTVGRCTEAMAGVLGGPLGCTLPHGHAGQHHDATTGAHWWPGWQRRRWLGRVLIALGERLS